MNRNLLFLFACCALNFSMAQSLSPEVISSAGSSFTNSSATLDWTVGEPVTSTLNNSNNILSQGFHQPNLLVTAISEAAADYSVTLFPNPTVDLIQLQILNTLNEIIFIDLHNAEGKLLLSQQINTSSNLQIDMSKYSTGTYLLSLTNNQEKIKTYQIIKSN